MTTDSVGKSYRSIEEVRETVYQGELRNIDIGLRTGLMILADAEEARALAKANRQTISPEEREAWYMDQRAPPTYECEHCGRQHSVFLGGNCPGEWDAARKRRG